jgi:TolA-binding protein
MNTSLLASIKWIITKHGKDILSDPLRLKPIFVKFAKNEPKEERIAFGRCIEIGSYKELKKAQTENERGKIKGDLILRLQSVTKLNTKQCGEAIDLLDAAIFGNVVQPQITQIQKAPVSLLPHINTPKKVRFYVLRKRIFNKKAVKWAGLSIVIILLSLLSVTLVIKNSRQNAVIQEITEENRKKDEELIKINKYQKQIADQLEQLKIKIEDQKQLTEQIEQLKKQIEYQENIAAQLAQLRKQIENLSSQTTQQQNTGRQSSTSSAVQVSPSLSAALKVRDNLCDANYDGKITCIDYALLYKYYFGNGTQARLIWNYNKNKNLNHLFCSIPDDNGGWIYIEPSRTSTSLSDRTMSSVWGSMYNPYYNRDVTYAYNEIKNGTYRWVW